MRTITATLCLLVAGCISSNVVRLGATTYEPRAKDHPIAVYAPEESSTVILQAMGALQAKGVHTVVMPAGALLPPCEKIGRVDVSGAPATGWMQAIEVAQVKARELGGDAIWIGGAGSPVTGVGSWGEVYHGKAIGVVVLRNVGGG